MTITLRIPHHKQISPDQMDKNIKLEISKHPILHRVAILFTGGIPSDQVREILKSNGWCWNPKYKVWYAKNEKDDYENINFANKLKVKYFEK